MGNLYEYIQKANIKKNLYVENNTQISFAIIFG